MSQIVNIPCTGSVDKDTLIDLIKEGNFIDSLNTSSVSRSGNMTGGRVTSVGNQPFPVSGYVLPDGYNQVIGGVADPVRNRIIDFLYNSSGHHQIRLWDFSTMTVKVLIEDNIGGAMVFNTQNALNFDLDYKITSVNILHREASEGDIMYWTDGKNAPKQINITKSANGTAPYNDLFADSLLQGKMPPLFCPQASYINDTNHPTNNLRSKLFQFAYRYVYDDYSKSTYSPWSKVPLPNGSTDPAIDSVYTNNNRIDIIINNGAQLVVGIEVIGRIGVGGNGGWTDPFLIQTIDKADIGGSSTYTLNFYNDGNYQSVDVRETNLLFSFVPQISGCQDFINGNVLIHGDITEGYDYNDVSLDVSMQSVTDTYQGGESTPLILQQGDFTVALSVENDREILTVTYVGDSAIIGTAIVTVIVHLHFPIRSDEDRTYTVNITNAQSSVSQDIGPTNVLGIDYTIISYVVFGFRQDPDGDDDFFSISKYDWGCRYQFGLVYFDKLGRTNTVYTNDAMKISAAGYRRDLDNNTYVLPAFTASISHRPPSWAVSYQWVRSKNMTESFFLYWEFVDFKQDSDFYYFDISNLNYNYLEVNPSTNFRYDFAPGDRLLVAQEDHLLGHHLTLRTEFAIVGVVENPKAGDGDFVTGAQVTNPGFGYTSAPSVEFSGGGGTGAQGVATITPNGQLDTIKITNPGSGYTSAPTISITGGGGQNATAVAIAGYYPGTFIKVNNNDELAGEPAYPLIKIYRPALNVSEDDKVFYEFGEVYAVINPGTANAFHGGMTQNQTQAQPALFRFTDGDVYFTGAHIPSSVYEHPTPFFPVTPVMAQNYDDHFPSAQISDGRAEAIFKEAKRLRYETLVRFSESYIPDTVVNRLNIYYDANQDEYDRRYGAIRRFSFRENFLRVFQELKVGRVPVAQSVIQTAVGNNVVAQSDRLINNIQYNISDFGIGDAPHSLSRQNYADYFCDTNRGVICRVSNDGIDPLSILYGANSVFGNLLPKYNSNLIDSTDPNPGKPNQSKPAIYGLYDTFRNEYVVALETVDRFQNGSQILNYPALTYGFSESKKGFEGEYSWHPEFMLCLNNLVCSFKGGLLYTHDGDIYDNFYGQQYDSYVTIVINEALMNDKAYLALKETANAIWASDQISTNLGQLSSLPSNTFAWLEGNPSASFLRDQNSAGGLFNGQPLKGKWLTIRLRVTPSDKELYLTALKINYNVYP